MIVWHDNGALVNDWETMELELETDDDNPESELGMSGDRVCRRVENLSEDSKASILESESDSNKLDPDFEYSGYEERCGVECKALLDSCFHFQKWLLMEMTVEYSVWKVEGLQVEIIFWMQSGSPK